MICTKRKYFNFKRILVTGGAGFIGSHFINSLLKSSEAIIFNLDKLGYASNLNRITESKNNSNYKFINLDLVDKFKIKELLPSIQPDLIIHFAAESHVDKSILNPETFIESNILGTFNLLESIRNLLDLYDDEKRKNFKFLHISTDEVYGSLGKYGFFSENTPYDPRSPYSASKAASDHLVRAWSNTYSIPIIKTNCSNNYGPWQFPEKLIPVIIKKILKDEKIPIYGDGSNIRDWLFVEDHINAILLILEKGKLGNTYCIGGNNEISNLKVVQIIFDEINKLNPKDRTYEKLIDFVPDRLGHDKRYAIDSSKIKNELGWEPKFTFQEGIKITVEWYLKNFSSFMDIQ